MLANLTRLDVRMKEARLDGLVAATIENVHYLTGFTSVSLTLHPYFGQCYAVVTADAPGKPTVVSSSGEIDQVLDGFAEIADGVNFGTFYREMAEGVTLTEPEARMKALSVDSAPAADPVTALAVAIERRGLKGGRVGIDENGLRLGVLEALQAKLPDTELVPASDHISWVRRVKTAEEVRRIRKSAHVTQQAIRAAIAIAREGVTEEELYIEFNRTIASQGGLPRFTFIKFGRNGVGGQVKSNRTTLAKGDNIWFDVGCVYEGYWSDLARTFAFGEPSPRVAKLYEAMRVGEERAILDTRPGMTGGDVFRLTMEATREAGAPHYQRHHVGHGIGAEVYEQPILADANTVEIEAGMVLNTETPYYEFGTGGIHVEDPFVVGADGKNELLTTLGRELHVIEP